MKRANEKVMGAVVLALVLLLTGRTIAGNLDPTNAPGPTMHTLEEIYQKVQDLAPQTLQTLLPNTAVVDAGYYAATNLTQVDTDLTAGNIATNVTIFGIAGTLSASGGTTYESIIRLSGGMDFGNVITGATKAATLTIWNDGDCAMTVSGLQYSDGSFSGNCTGKVLAGGSTNVTVTFAPVLLQAYSGTITVNCDYTHGTNTMACTGSGINAGRYVDHGDGTVTDTATGLMWTKNSNHAWIPWADAVAYCDNLVTNGYSDWRLPSLHQQDGPGGPMGNAELETLFRANGDPSGAWEGPAGTPFTGADMTGWHWSSTTWSGNMTSAWLWIPTAGTTAVGNKPNSAYVWPVRGP